MELFLVCTCNSIIHVWFELLFFIIPVFEQSRTYLVQLASGAVTSMPRV